MSERSTAIYVHKGHLQKNAKDGGCRPVVCLWDGERESHALGVSILDESGRVVARVVYEPDDPLDGRVHVWVETDCEVIPHNG